MSTSKLNQTKYLPESPFPGINPFSYAYKDVFFARESETRSLVRLIVLYRGVLLYSDSGAGKSSLINAGIIPLAMKEGYQPERIRVQPRKGEEIVIERLSENVAGEPPFLPSIFASGEQQEDVVLSVEEFEKAVRQSVPDVLPLLIFDQFEEWATLFEEKAKDEARNAKESVRDLISSFINDSKFPVKILIVLREDYLAKLEPLFEKCPNLPDQYLRLSPLKGDQIHRVIRGPFEERPGRYQPEVSDSLAKEIQTQFEKRSKGTDIHLTEVQIVCQNLFEAGRRRQKIEKYFVDEGGVQGILERFLEDTLEALEVDQREAAVSLLARMVTPAGTRNVISEDDLLKRVENEDQIPHELLVKTLSSLEQETKLVWKEPRREVYYYEIASEFLVRWIQKKAQERQQLAEIRVLEERAEIQARAHKRQRHISLLLAATLLILGACTYLLYYCFMRKHVSYYNTFVKRWGFPEGVGQQLTKRQVQSRAASLRFTRKGRYGPLLRMEAVDSRGQLTRKHNIGIYLKLEENQFPHCQWEFIRDSEGQIVYEIAYDKDDNLVWGFVYSPAVKDDRNKSDAHFIGPDGYPRILTKSAANFVSFEYSPQGYEEYIHYFDRKHNPIRGPDKAFGKLRQDFNKFGLPEKITSVDDSKKPMIDEAGNATLNITYDELGNIVKAVALDASGGITALKSGWAKAVFKYDDMGRLIEERWLGVDGEPTLHQYGYHKGNYIYDSHGNIIKYSYYGVDEKPKLVNAGYAHVVALYDKQHNRIREAYFDINNKPTICNYGYHAAKLRYDREGYVSELVYLDVDGNPKLMPGGYAKDTRKYNSKGKLTVMRYFSADGMRITHTGGYHGFRKRYDDRGQNVVEKTFFDIEDQPILKDDGYASCRKEYDFYGNIIKTSYLGLDDKKLVLHKWYECAGWKSKYDDRCNEVMRHYFDVNEESVIGPNGCAEWRSEYNDYDQQVEKSYFGTNGERVLCKKGYFRYTREYDDGGDLAGETYYGVDGKPAISKQGYASWKAKYDQRRNQIEQSYYGTEGEPILYADSYASWKAKYDQHGNQIEKSYYGTEGEPVLYADGYATWKAKYDQRGNQIEKSYYGTEGEPVLYADGYASWKAKYDQHDNQIEKSYYGTEGEPVLCREGYARYIREYNDKGNLISVAYYGCNNELVLGEEGYARYTREYDDGGNLTGETYYGVDGKPAISKQGYASWKAKYDQRRNQIEQSYYGTNGEPILYADGYASWKAKYDQHDNQIEKSYYGTNGEPVSGERGYARYTNVYDNRGNVLKKFFFGVDGKPYLFEGGYSGWTSEYDDEGNTTGVTYYGRDGKSTEIEYGYASWKAKYDQHGNQIETSYYGTDGKPASNKNEQGIARYTSEYDYRGKLIKRSFFGVDGKPYLFEGGYSGWTSEYDDEGNTMGVTYYGRDGKSTEIEYGYASWKAKYDQHGNQIETSYYGTDGKPILCNEGYFRMEQKFNERRQLLEMTTYDVELNLVLNSSGFARVIRKYDERGNLTEIAAFDTNGKFTNAFYGYARMINKYDEWGNQVEEAYFGENGGPITTDDTYTRWVSKLDEYGNAIETTYYGTDGQPINRLDGYARIVRKFNERRQMVEERFFDPDNEATIIYNGPHIIRYKYDDRGNKIEEAYFSIDEKPVLFHDEDHRPCARWIGEYDTADELIRKRYYDERNQLITSVRFAGSVRSVIIGTGDVGGIYYHAGRAISRMINNESKQYNMKATVKSTEGSVYNINTVLNGEFDFGIAQSDRQYQAYKGKAEWSQSGPQKDLMAIFSLHSESITLVASNESRITSVDDLRGKRVNIGSPGSGQLQNSKDVLSAFGIDLNDIKAEQKDVFEALGLLRSSEIDAFFYTVGHPNVNIKQVTSGKVKVNIIPIEGEGIDTLLEKYPYYTKAVIPDNFYPNTVNKGDVNSIGVKATFITSKNQDEKIVYAITKEVFDNLEDFKKLHPAYSALTRENMLKDLSIPIHKGALKYYEEADLIKYIDPELRQ